MRGPFAGTYIAVCEAAKLARGGETGQARTAFFDRAHQGIHQLAAKTAEHDRPAAGRMLERKERVEHDFDAKASPAQLGADLDQLAATARAAMAATGARRPPACQDAIR